MAFYSESELERHLQYVEVRERDFRHKNLYKILLHYMEGRTLDIGSGKGILSFLVSQKARQVHAVDISPSQVKFIMKTKEIRNCDNISPCRMSAQYLGYKSNVFDIVLTIDLLEHLDDDFLCLKEVKRVLKSDRRCIIVVPAFKYLFDRYDENLGHYRRYHKKEILDKLRKLDFEICLCRYWNFIGVLPYLLFGKVLKRDISKFVRGDIVREDINKNKSVLKKIMNDILYHILKMESIIYPPLGLSLFIVVKKK